MFCLLIILQLLTSTDAITLTGSSEYAVPGHKFTMICGVPEETVRAMLNRFDGWFIHDVGDIDVYGGQCRDTFTSPSDLCSPGVCSCTLSSTDSNYATEIRWVIQPRTRDHGSVWICDRYNYRLLPDAYSFSPFYTLKVADGPGIIVLTTPVTTYTKTEGDTLPDITCTANCIPNCTFVWTKPDHTNLTASAVLSLGQLDRAEHGSFRCTVRNFVGELTTTTSVKVLYDVNLSPSITSYTLTEGQTIPTITCSADCNPACTYSWTKDGQSHTTGSDLQLTNIQRGQTGVYRCTASNAYGSQTSSDVSVTVNYGPGTIALTPPATTYTRPEGDTLPDITCTADCRPDCTFVWTKPDNTNLTASAVLSLGQLDRAEHGTYRCTARNIAGELTTTISVMVLYDVNLSPSITSYTLTEGQTIPTITCSADCNPACTYSWTKDGQSHTSGSGLPLTNIQRGQAGVYRCTASNVYGYQTSNDVSVTVDFPPRILGLSYTQGDANVSEGGSKSLLCTVDSSPPSTIQWSYKANNSELLTITDVLESTYTLTTAGCLDTGLYTCSVKNSASNIAVTMDIPINVLCKPRPYQILDQDQTFNLAALDTLTMPAKFISNPEPSFTWTFQLSQFTPATTLVNGMDKFAIRNNFEMTNLFALSEGTRTDMEHDWFGLYNVTATNSQGSAMLSFTIREQPKLSDGNIAIIGGTAGAVAGVLLIICVVVVITRRRRHQPSTQQPTEDEHQYEEIGLEQVGIPVEDDVVTDQREQELYDDFSLEQIGIPAVDGVVTDNGGGATGDNRHQYDEIGMEQVGIPVEEDVVTDNAGGMPGENRQQYEALIPEQVEIPAAYDVLADNGGGMSGESSNAYLLMKKQPEDEYVDVSPKPDNDGDMSGESSNAYLLMKKKPEDEYVDVSPKPGTGQDRGYVNTSLR